MCLGTANAQTTVRDAWLGMPDEVIGYLNKDLRKEHLDYVDMKVRSEVKNLLQGQGVMDTLTNDYLSVHLNAVTNLELKVLQTTDSISPVYCMIRTVAVPFEDSELRFFNSDWSSLKESLGLPISSDRDKLLQLFTAKPDTMSQERFEEIQSMMDPVGLKIRWSEDKKLLLFDISYPFVNKDDDALIRTIIKQRKYKWDGKMFNEG